MGLVAAKTYLLLIAMAAGWRGEEGRQRFPCWSYTFKPHLLTHTCFSAAGAVCRCNALTLDCSSNFGNLTYIPKVFPRAQSVNFSNNELRRLTDDSFFVNVSRSAWLVDLFNNDMTFITPGAFRPLRRLRVVLIGGNRLTYESLRTAVLAIPTLNVLDIRCGHLGLIPEDYFSDVRATALKHLDLSRNIISLLDMRVLQPLKTLKIFYLRHNHLYRLITAYLPSVERISFRANRLFDFPVSCNGSTKDSLFPNLVRLTLTSNVISNIPDPICLPRLKLLDLGSNRIVHFTSNMFSVTRFPALQNLILFEMNAKIRQIEAYTFNNSKLKLMNFGFNFVDFSSSIVNADMFSGCSTLVHIYLNKNNFKTVSKEKLHSFFRSLSSVEKMYMGQVQLESIESDTFAYLPNLRHLYFYENSLFSLPDGAFQLLTRLQLLDLTLNQISMISRNTFSAQTRSRLVSIYMDQNPFECSCDLLWFQSWMIRAPALFKSVGYGRYWCQNLQNTTVQQFYLQPQTCLLKKSNSILIISFVCFALFLLSVIIGLFGYRWQLRLWLYAVCHGGSNKRRRLAERQAWRFQYDVFVAYAEEDVEWLLKELLPVLEERLGLRVCIHQRDFVPGKHILDNISDCVEASDRILMVLSPNFARSMWCQFELKFCQRVVMAREDVLVLVMLQETESRDMSGAMLAVLQTTTYIEWADQNPARESFWGRLELVLRDIAR